MNGAFIYPMLIACLNSEGEADIAFVKVVVPQNAENDRDIELATRWAEEQGYEGPFVVFNAKLDSAAIALYDKFDWDTASVYDGK